MSEPFHPDPASPISDPTPEPAGPDPRPVDPDDPIFQPLEFRNLTVKNRLFRSNLSGRWDTYNGYGNPARINWELKFARGGVGAILSSYVPVHLSGRILPNYAVIDDDDKIPFWREVAKAVHKHDCKYIIQLSHGGRQRDIPGVDNFMEPGMSTTDEPDEFIGLPARNMSTEEVHEIIGWFAQAARRSREAGIDGIELHASHGYLFTQFLSPAINQRTDEYGGSLENRARFLLEVIRAIRKEVGTDYHLQAKINAMDFANYLFPWRNEGTTLEESLQVFQWAVAEGLDGVHVSIGSSFPHPLLPPGGFPPDELKWWFGSVTSSGIWGFRNYLALNTKWLRPFLLYAWNRIKKKHPVEGVAVEYAREVKKVVDVPVLCTGGFQDGELIRRVIQDGWVDGVSIARPLIANNDLPRILAAGGIPERPCSFCNRCLINAPANPLGCYDVRRFDGDQDAMVEEIMSVFTPPAYTE